MSQIPYITELGVQELAQLIFSELLTKVDVESGKGLSTNDFTTALKQKLEGIVTENLLSATEKAKIHEHANKSILDAITQAAVDAWNDVVSNAVTSLKVNGIAQQISNNEVNVTIPTAVSQLSNDSLFQTQAQVTAAIAAAVGSLTEFNIVKVNSLPASGVKGTFYLVPATGGEDPDYYDEYIWTNGENGAPGAFEKTGTSEAKLSNYWAKSELTFSEITPTRITEIFNGIFHPSQSDNQAGE